MNTLFVAGATILIALALAFVALPLWRNKKNTSSTPAIDMRALYLQKLDELEADLQTGSISAEEFENASNELKKSLLDDISGAQAKDTEKLDNPDFSSLPLILRPKILSLFISIMLPALTLGVYSVIGSGSQGMLPASNQQESPTSVKHPAVGQASDMENLVQRLEKRLGEQPDDPQGWSLLVRSYRFLGLPEQAQEAVRKAESHGYQVDLPEQTGSLQQTEKMLSVAKRNNNASETQTNDFKDWIRLAYDAKQKKEFSEAAKAFAKAVEFEPNNPDLLADYADALAMTQNRSLKGQPLVLVNKALAIDPNHPKALWLAATAALEDHDKALAKNFWERLLQILPQNSQDRKIIEANLAELDEPPAGESQSPVMAKAQKQIEVHGTISLASGLDPSKFNKNDTIFIFAKAVEGPNMPLAVMRIRMGDLPAKFVLNDSMAMRPDLKLSNFRQVMITAKVSKTGSALATDSNLRSTTKVVDLTHASEIHLILDRRAQP